MRFKFFSKSKHRLAKIISIPLKIGMLFGFIASISKRFIFLVFSPVKWLYKKSFSVFASVYLKLVKIPVVGKIFSLPISIYEIATLKYDHQPLFPQIGDTIAYLMKLRKENIRYKGNTILILCAIFGIFLYNSKATIIKPKQYVAKIKIHGRIDTKSYGGKEFRDVVTKVIKDKRAVAVIVEINSPGGAVTTSGIIYKNIRRIAKSKPTIALITEVGASAAYKAAVACDRIFANEDSVVGSIGVLMQNIEVTELAKKLGITLEMYKSNPLKAAPNGFEKTTPEVAKAAMDDIKEIYDSFVSLVKERRNLKDSEAKLISTGRAFSGRQALKYKLIDEIGDEIDIMDSLKESGLIGKNVNVVEINQAQPKDKNSNSMSAKVVRYLAKTLNIAITDVMSESLYQDQAGMVSVMK